MKIENLKVGKWYWYKTFINFDDARKIKIIAIDNGRFIFRYGFFSPLGFFYGGQMGDINRIVCQV